MVTQKCGEWVRELGTHGKGAELSQELIELLSKPEEIEEKLRIKQFGILEPLRGVIPEAWRHLVVLSSERQLAAIALAYHWTKGLSHEQIEQLGISKPELMLFIEMAVTLGKYIDHAYVRQIEIADQPGGSGETKRGKERGASYLYDLYTSPESDDIEIRPYIEAFPDEWPRIVKRFEGLATKIERLLEKVELPESYNGFPHFLKQMAETYGSRETTSEKLFYQWQALLRSFVTLAETGCPIMLTPQNCASVAGEANKVDVELRFGIRTNRTRDLESACTLLRKPAQEIIDQHKESLKTPYLIPPVIFNFQPFAHGPNLFWYTMGEGGLLRYSNPHQCCKRGGGFSTPSPFTKNFSRLED